jgi:ABC-type phosphate/phosphonate transport system substrate-binding protein
LIPHPPAKRGTSPASGLAQQARGAGSGPRSLRGDNPRAQRGRLLDSRTVLSFLFPPSLGHIAASARAELLSQWFVRHLGTSVDIAVAPTYEALRMAIEQRRVDLAWAPPVVCAAVQGSSLAILKAVRSHSSSYRAALVVRTGEVTSLEGLRGARAAWVDRLSTGGYLLPMAHLRERGCDPDRLLAEQSFAGSYGRALRTVLDREADLASIYVTAPSSEALQASLRDVVGEAAPRLRALDFTAESPSDGLVIVDRPAHGDNHQLLQQIRELTDGRKQTLLLTVLDAEALEPAASGDYDLLRPPAEP